MPWLNRLLSFLRKLLRNQDRRSVRILESYYGDRVAVFRLQDSGIPGAVDLWRINREYERTRFFVCTVNLSALRQDIGSYRATSDGASGGGLAGHLSASLKAQRHISGTHLFLTGWDREFSGVDSQGRNYRSSRLVDVNILSVDLQGAASAFAGDRYAVRITRKIIVSLAANDFKEYQQHQSWVAAVKTIDWLQWLELLCRGPGGISSDHIIQPRHSRLRVPPDE